MPGRVYTILFDAAVDRYGYLTTTQARELGVNPQRLVDMERRGLLERIDQGLYRMRAVPATGLDQLMEATLWPRGGGVLSHDTALDLHELCDVNPSKVHLTVPARYRIRRTVPPVYVLYRRDLDPGEVTRHEGIPVVTPLRAILDGMARHLGAHLIDQAIDTATRRGLVIPAERELIDQRRGALTVA